MKDQSFEQGPEKPAEPVDDFEAEFERLTQLDQEWRTFAEAVYPKVRGGMVPAEMFDKARQLVAEYRSSHPGTR